MFYKKVHYIHPHIVSLLALCRGFKWAFEWGVETLYFTPGETFLEVKPCVFNTGIKYKLGFCFSAFKTTLGFVLHSIRSLSADRSSSFLKTTLQGYKGRWPHNDQPCEILTP